MLRYTTQVAGLKLHAKDGNIGRIDDCYFDDSLWALRYFVVDTGGWLTERQVLVAPAAVESPEWDDGVLHVNLTREQVEKSPEVAADKPVSRQVEERLSQHYGWPMYWSYPPGTAIGAVPPVAPSVPPNVPADEQSSAEPAAGDPHLRSMNEVKGYHVQATDDEVGHVEDYLVDRERWVVRFVVVDTRNWLPGRKVLVAPDWFTDVRWDEHKVAVDLTQQNVKDSPRYEPTRHVDEDYANQLHDYYGRPNRWSAAPAAPVHWQ